MIKLYGSSLSPYVRKVVLVLEHKRIPYEQDPLSPVVNPSEEFLRISPLRKIPVLRDGDFVLPDSSVICRYLEDAYPEPALYPRDVRARAFACWLEEFSDTKLALSLAAIAGERLFKPRFMKQPPDEANVARIVNEELPGPLAYLESVTPAAGFLCGELSIADLVRRNEGAWRSAEETDAFVDMVRAAMFQCIERGCKGEGILPGGLNVRRRAGALCASLSARGPRSDPSAVFEWVSLWALAVNEENAAGGRVVTAPTNGAAGIIPAVIKHYCEEDDKPNTDHVRAFLATAAGVGMLYKQRASISGAEMGCQGEVGVACSMAAAGLAAIWGGSAEQVEHAAEIGMEHNLGLTCDPVGGLVQIPCIERNAIGAVKAVNAARLALRASDSHKVSLDQVIETMRQTGLDMSRKYKETSEGGLAVNVVEC